jgi:hypothetical protein
MATLGVALAAFRFFLAFAGEVMDRYGRLLGYIQSDQPNTPAGQRLGSYNERLLRAGWVSPYFIWPNTNPWRKALAIVDAVPAPGTAAQAAAADTSLSAARAGVKNARHQQVGLYETAQPLRLQAFELRILSRRQPPDRWLIDLTSTSDTLIPPQSYPSVPLPEDRLFIPAEYVSLWVEKGWKRPSADLAPRAGRAPIRDAPAHRPRPADGPAASAAVRPRRSRCLAEPRLFTSTGLLLRAVATG